MKKVLLAIAAVATITSCSQNEEFENPGQKAEINFGTVVSKTTRAAVTKIAELKKSGFTVYAYNTGNEVIGAALDNPIMNGVAVTYPEGGDAWTFSGTYYWPLNDYVQFFAYATDAAVTDYTTVNGYPTFKYTIDSDVAKQKDFVVAKVTDQKKKESALTLPFSHALTQVNFSVIGADDKNYKISSISIQGVAESGSYSFKDGWVATANETSGSYTYPIAEDASVASSATAVKLDQINGALMLMPQAMTATAKIVISYSVYDGATEISKSENTEISLDKTAAWEAGKKVRYTLKLANNAATMTFAPEVGDWSTDDDTPVAGETK